MSKTDFINCRLDSDKKKKLRDKAAELGLDLTQFIEKIADEPIIFMDKNVQRLVSVLQVGVRK